MYNNSPIIERYTKHHTWVFVGVSVVSLGVGVWQGEKNRSAAKKAQKKAGQNLEQAHAATTQKAKIKQLRAENAQLAQAANALLAQNQQRGALEGGSDNSNMILYAALGVGAIVLLKGK